LTCHHSSSPKIKTKRSILVVDDEYADLNFISEEKGRHVFLKTDKSMLLIFNPENTRIKENSH
jgi:hypothetical protein